MVYPKYAGLKKSNSQDTIFDVSREIPVLSLSLHTYVPTLIKFVYNK